MIYVIAIVASVVPPLLMYFWIRNKRKDKPGYAASCKSAFLKGLLTTLPVFGTALVLNIIGGLLQIDKINDLLWQAYRCFLMFALTEEFWKDFFARKELKKTECDYTWYDIVAFTVAVHLGFEVIESVVYAFTMSPGQSIIRGVTMMHGVFGFITGYFYGKALYTGKKWYKVLAFVLPFLYHAIYDWTLSPVWDKYVDWIAIIPVTLAAASLVLVIVMIIFFNKKNNDEKYLVSLRTDKAE